MILAVAISCRSIKAKSFIFISMGEDMRLANFHLKKIITAVTTKALYINGFFSQVSFLSLKNIFVCPLPVEFILRIMEISKPLIQAPSLAGCPHPPSLWLVHEGLLHLTGVPLRSSASVLSYVFNSNKLLIINQPTAVRFGNGYGQTEFYYLACQAVS